MREIVDDGPYVLLGYSYGASIAFEIATLLQTDNPDNPSVLQVCILYPTKKT